LVWFWFGFKRNKLQSYLKKKGFTSKYFFLEPIISCTITVIQLD
jgi:hypothetical protein